MSPKVTLCCAVIAPAPLCGLLVEVFDRSRFLEDSLATCYF